MNKVLLIFGLIIFGAQGPKAQPAPAQMDPKEDWVQDKLLGLSLEEKIGQLMMIRAHSDKGPDHVKSVKEIIKKYNVGSLCFFQGTPQKQAELTNSYQEISKIPLIVAIDGEWGLGMRFTKDVVSYPRQLTLGAVRNDELIYKMGKEVAYDLRRIGIHLNFAPVVDVNNNPLNPVINNRSFGEDKDNVTSKSYQYMQGMQDGGVVACAKHFPGHGDTDVDSHYDLPIINFDYNRLDSLELYPFKQLSKRGVESMMIAHLHVPALDSRPNRPTTLSENTIKNVLRDSLGFQGLIITDAMEMEGVTKHFDPGVAEAEAILAGNDIICLPRDVGKAIDAIKKYVEEGKIEVGQIDNSVRKILEKKYELGLNITPKILLNDITKDLLRPEGLVLKARLLEEAITLVEDTAYYIPFVDIQNPKYATLAIGSVNKTDFQHRVDEYIEAEHFQSGHTLTREFRRKVIAKAKEVDHMIVHTVDMSKYARKKFGLDPSFISFIKELKKRTKVHLVVFGSPYALEYFEDLASITLSYTDDSLMQDRTAQALFGAINIRGQLPVSAGAKYKFGQGIQRSAIMRLGYASPEEVGLDSDSLQLIESIVDEMIETKAAPGCQILIAKDQKIVYHKAFGTLDYSTENKARTNHIYDVASITKIAAATISAMRLSDQGLLDINGTMIPFIPGIDTTDKKDKIMRDMMAHHAALKPWIPFYKYTIDLESKKQKPLPKYYRRMASDSFSIEVANNLYMRTDYVDSMWQQIITSPLRDDNNYRYSDLAFYFMMRAIESQANMTLDSFCYSQFYRPLGLTRTGFKPKTRHDLKEIAPSEKDSYFRNQKVHGHVHDMGAAMLGGVSGHAGLFSTSKDLAIIMQMLLNGGYYGGKSFFSPQTVLEYTTRFPNSTRRGIGFDMKELDTLKTPNMSELAPESTFGHLGFTGTCAFADPENNIVFVMLSNRTYPTMENNKFGRKNYRPRVQSVIYKALRKED